jgi:hypothetical protein
LLTPPSLSSVGIIRTIGRDSSLVTALVLGLKKASLFSDLTQCNSQVLSGELLCLKENNVYLVSLVGSSSKSIYKDVLFRIKE